MAEELSAGGSGGMARAPLDAEAVKKGRQEVGKFDYVKLTWHDMYGCSRSRVIPGRHAATVIPDGSGIYEGAMYVGPRGEMPDPLHEAHFERLSEGLGNIDCIPDPRTLRPVPWAGANKYKVGEMLCDLVSKEGKSLPTMPRTVARRQIARLDALGLKLMSSFEIEFILEDRETHKPVFDEPDIFSSIVFNEYEKYLYQVDQQMLEYGVDCEMLQTEYGPGQFEITMVPVWGITCADDAFRLKSGLKEIAHQHGFEATFMAKPDPKTSGTGAHFNFSIWKTADDSNVFYDKADKLGLSQFARYWIGGLMAHGRALAVLQNPTVNCYRRLQGAWAPSKSCWGIENRNALLRIKVGSQKSTYMENRLPSGSANYYLVMAATIAAGLDGVNKCIEPPPEGLAHAQTLPLTLLEAVEVLEEDTVIIESLGVEFVEWFCLLKRMVDLELLKDSDMTKPDPIALAKERHMYNVTM